MRRKPPAAGEKRMYNKTSGEMVDVVNRDGDTAEVRYADGDVGVVPVETLFERRP